MPDHPLTVADRDVTETETAGGWALGLMSGTSLDGIDAALIKTDGRAEVESGAFLTVPYDDAFRAQLRAVLGGQGDVAGVERALTLRHAEVVEKLLTEAGLAPPQITVIGFHGHTILHAPERGRTWQIGDGALLAAETGIDVVSDLRGADVAAGGEGAPLVPLYQAALARGLERPLAVVNIGGVANVTYLAETGLEDGSGILAFDTGPGNALLDDWMFRLRGEAMDLDGALARAGRVDEAVLAKLLGDPYFKRAAPKSLDRDAFDMTTLAELSVADGAATLTAFTVRAVALSRDLMPAPPKRWLVTGGGRRNGWMMAQLAACLEAPAQPVEAVGWDGDALEAQAFAYLAVRSLAGLPLSLPTTTGVAEPTGGGRLSRAEARRN